jgi:hypothetical protein
VYTPSQTVKLTIVELGASLIEGFRDKNVDFIPSNVIFNHAG